MLILFLLNEVATCTPEIKCLAVHRTVIESSDVVRFQLSSSPLSRYPDLYMRRAYDRFRRCKTGWLRLTCFFITMRCATNECRRNATTDPKLTMITVVEFEFRMEKIIIVSNVSSNAIESVC